MRRRTIRGATLFCVVLVCSCGKEEEVEPKEYPEVSESALEGVIRTNLDSPDPTEAQLQRKARNIEIIQKLGLPYIEHLPVVEDEQQIEERDPGEVARRCIAVLLCAVKGETQGNDEALVRDLVKDYQARSYFSPVELAFIENTSPARQELIDFAWRYECAHVLLWALGHLDHLQEPNAICNVADEVGILRDKGPTNFVQDAQLRSQADILDMADLYYRLHWAAIDLRLKGKKSDAVNEGIVRERHRALNWLIRYMDQKWDDVTTDT